MPRILNKIVTIFLLSSMLPCNTFAWNLVGHMIVANVAYKNLKPSVRSKVDNLVGFFQKEYSDIKTFTLLATWPDTIRAQKIDLFSRWHYIDNPFTDDRSNFPADIVTTDNAVWAVKSMQSPLKNPHANSFERVRLLAFFTHIVGDLHQPLHTVSRVSQEYPHGDKGGNLYSIRYNNIHNLHALWDEGLGSFNCKGFASSCVTDLSQKILALYPKTYFGNKVNDLDPKSWAAEGMDYAKEYVYQTPENKTPSNAYLNSGKKLVEEQVALAGYRLANLLNQLLA